MDQFSDSWCSYQFRYCSVNNSGRIYQYLRNGAHDCGSQRTQIILLPGFGWAIKLLQKFPGKIGNLATKAFGDSAYEMDMSDLNGKEQIVDAHSNSGNNNYRVCSLAEFIRRTEQ